jgi:signal transduction histidine kinase
VDHGAHGGAVAPPVAADAGRFAWVAVRAAVGEQLGRSWVLPAVLLAATVVDHLGTGVHAGIALGGPYRPFDVPAMVVAAAQALPIAFRRRAPATVLTVVIAAYVLDDALRCPPSAANLALLVALHGAALRTEGRARRLLLVPIGLGAVADAAVLTRLGLAVPWVLLALGALLALAWVWGLWARDRAQLRARAEESAVHERRMREAQLREAVAAERVRLARELHDTIAHHVTVMIVQADAALVVDPAAPPSLRSVLASVGDTGRETLTELRALLGVLRAGEEPEAEAAPLGVHLLDELVDRVRRAGLDVEVRQRGRPAALRSDLDAGVFRVVQESLTNALRHGGRGPVRVDLNWTAAALEVTVEAPLGGTGPPLDAGHGLVGMRERTQEMGGRLRAGPDGRGRFVVRVDLPIGEPA